MCQVEYIKEKENSFLGFNTRWNKLATGKQERPCGIFRQIYSFLRFHLCSVKTVKVSQKQVC